MFYSVLEVNKKATDEEIRAAYRKLALRYHPDKNNGVTSEEFQNVQRAYEVLGDKEKRAEYDEGNKKKRERMKGFVKPDPFPSAPRKPFTFKLADGSMYKFESAIDRVKCRLQSGDIIAFDNGPQKTNGVFIGIATDDYLYWCSDGTDYAQRLCHSGSDMGLRSITVVQRANLESHRPGAFHSSTPRGGGKKTPRGGASAKELYATLRKKEEAKSANSRLQRIGPEEAEERAEMEEECLSALDKMYTDITVTLRALEKKMPMDKKMWNFMGYDTPPKVPAASPKGTQKEVRLSPSSGLPPGLHEFSSPQVSIVADSEHCRTPPPFSPNASFHPSTTAAATGSPPASAPRKSSAVPAQPEPEPEPAPADAVYHAFTLHMEKLNKEDDDNDDQGDDDDGLGDASTGTFNSRDVDMNSNEGSRYSRTSSSDEDDEDEVGYQIASERLPKASSAKNDKNRPTSGPHSPTGEKKPHATTAAKTPAATPTKTQPASPKDPASLVGADRTFTGTNVTTVGSGSPPQSPAPPTASTHSPPALDTTHGTCQLPSVNHSRNASMGQPLPRATATPRVNPPAPPVARTRPTSSTTATAMATSPSQPNATSSGNGPLNSESPQRPTQQRSSGPASPPPQQPTSPHDAVRSSTNAALNTGDSLPTSSRGPGPFAPVSQQHTPLHPLNTQSSLNSPPSGSPPVAKGNPSSSQAVHTGLSPAVPPLSKPQVAGEGHTAPGPSLHSPGRDNVGTGGDSALWTPESTGGALPTQTVTSSLNVGLTSLSALPTETSGVRRSQGRKTPRYMDATRSALKRVQSTQVEELAAGTPAVEGVALGSGAATPRQRSGVASAAHSRARYDSFTAEELFQQEAEYMESFGKAKKKGK